MNRMTIDLPCPVRLIILMTLICANLAQVQNLRKVFARMQRNREVQCTWSVLLPRLLKIRRQRLSSVVWLFGAGSAQHGGLGPCSPANLLAVAYCPPVPEVGSIDTIYHR